ncbi:MAG: hypothetical protein XD75_0500, partial [Parcubacteria bacterium 33_209]
IRAMPPDLSNCGVYRVRSMPQSAGKVNKKAEIKKD